MGTERKTAGYTIEQLRKQVREPVRLFTAAPDLLEACQAALREPRPWAGTVQERKDALVYRQTIQAAITKATGEPPELHHKLRLE
jgi:hypothetical protein